MCGIFALLNNSNYSTVSKEIINECFNKGSSRGPEYSVLTNIMIQTIFGFHRLAINGIDEASHQPIVYNDVALICNGEIYNYKKLHELSNENNDIVLSTNSDCEIIIHLYLKYGIEHTVRLLDGVFSFALIDYRLSNDNTKLYVVRDPYGVRPLYYLKPDNKNNNEPQIYAFGSEMKTLYGIWKQLEQSYQSIRIAKKENCLKLQSNNHKKYKIHQFTPGTIMTFELPFQTSNYWSYKNTSIYQTYGFSHDIFKPLESTDKSEYYRKINQTFKEAVYKRCVTTDRPIACLLSGGLDSSLVTALVNEYHKENNLGQLETYSIGLEGSEDLKNSQIVADYLGTKHTQVVVSEDDFTNAIESVIKDIESYDTTTVRASIGNWLVSQYISKNSDAKVIFNGDGSDELMGGYLYMKYADDPFEFDKECKRLLKDIYMYDVLRSDKSISSHGLEPRTPFLDRTWVNFYLSIPLCIRYNQFKIEKFLIRKAFSIDFYKNKEGKQLLPQEILWRRKEAFSDGVSTLKKDTKNVICDKIRDKVVPDNDILEFTNSSSLSDHQIVNRFIKLDSNKQQLESHLTPRTIEECYYRKIFEKHYAGCGKIVPYFWMPKYIDATDSSARSLDIYKETASVDE
jgi:asparagine synthase (glutamine-hydrolysing)